ncbi:Cloroperoxidase [Aulographum hederae CBS 113979]|uniref:Cloroperoxidase n=1 Tax=Aulographum hederae CBS 113979 TaxID=1176131 RepID=A0A6G1GV48_9PEZI|nr:Cloroperoxidase [Aulographum hederae CBS 113979]
MQLQLLATFLTVSTVVAYPGARWPSFQIDARQSSSWLDGHEWKSPSQVRGAVRMPCPMMNTLANHAFLPRDGKGITHDAFVQAQVNGLNLSPDLATTITNGMLGRLGAPQNQSEFFNMDQFSFHDHTEHDASLSRLDKIQGDFVRVNARLVDTFLRDSKTDSLNTASIGASRARREDESVKAGSPPLSDSFVAAGQGEAALILLIFGTGSGDSRNAPKSMVKSWLLKEEFPTAQGFVRSETQITPDVLAPLTAGIKRVRDQLSNSTTPDDDGENGWRINH